jgi:hypothetical protein
MGNFRVSICFAFHRENWQMKNASRCRHGCQIFLDTIYQNGGEHTKLHLNRQVDIKCPKRP